MNFSVVNKSQLEGVDRLDAEYFQPYYLELEKNILETHSIQKWGTLKGKFITGPFGSEFNVENYDYSSNNRYVRGKDVKPFFLSTNDNVYIPVEDFERLKKYSLEEGDILTSVVGTLGNSAVVNKSNLPAIFSSKSTVFRSKIVNPFYLLAYLNSKYGQGLLLRSARGQVQTGLNIGDLKSLAIYLPSQEKQDEISRVVIESYKLLRQSKSTYKEAENLLLKELGLEDFKTREDLSFVVDFSLANVARRIDTNHFQPKYEEILRKLSSMSKLDSLNHHFQILKGKNFKYSENGEIGVLKTKQLGKQFINFDVEDRVKKEIVIAEKLPLLKNLDVVFASMGVGSLGKTNIYYDWDYQSAEYTIDSTLRIFRKTETGKILPEVLTVYLSSWLGQELIYKYIVGSSGIISIYENYLNGFPVPVLEKTAQKKVAALVKRSHEAKEKSKELLEGAKRKVEEMIGKGGEINNGKQ